MLPADVDERLVTQLRDGATLLMRPIVPDDKAALRNGFEQMSPESRYHRFFAGIRALSESQLRYLTEIDYHNHFAWLAILPDLADVPAVGVARWVRSERDPQIAEAAVAVIDDFHNRGIGTALLAALAGSAVDRGVTRFIAFVQPDNGPMLRLLEELGAVPVTTERGVRTLAIPLPADASQVYQSTAGAILTATAAGLLQGRSRDGRGIEFIRRTGLPTEAKAQAEEPAT
jgi:GNAT superfamily N-acetyltransferase